MDGQIAGNEYNIQAYLLFKRNTVPFQSELIGAFPKVGILKGVVKSLLVRVKTI